MCFFKGQCLKIWAKIVKEGETKNEKINVIQIVLIDFRKKVSANHLSGNAVGVC